MVLSGKEAALLAAALFALGHWPFEKAEARALLIEEKRAAGKSLSDAVFLRWRRRLEVLGLWNQPCGRWTPELIRQRAAVQAAVVVSLPELPLCIFALELATVEFSDNWDEFCIVTPGALDWCGVGPVDVVALAARFREAQRAEPSS